MPGIHIADLRHTIGIYQAILFLDEVEQVRFTMDDISYDNTRYVNGHVDYKTKANGGPWLQHLSQLPGYPNGIYQKGAGDGVIHLTDQDVHQVRIEVKDANGNSSTLRFQVQYKPWAAATLYRKGTHVLSADGGCG